MAASIFSGKIQGRTGLSPSQLPVKVFWAFSLGPGEYSVAASIFVVTLMEPGHLGDGHNHPSQMSQRSQQLCKCQNQIRMLAASAFCVVQMTPRLANALHAYDINTKLGRLGVWQRRNYFWDHIDFATCVLLTLLLHCGQSKWGSYFAVRAVNANLWGTVIVWSLP